MIVYIVELITPDAVLVQEASVIEGVFYSAEAATKYVEELARESGIEFEEVCEYSDNSKEWYFEEGRFLMKMWAVKG